jgi:phage terminase large subunit
LATENKYQYSKAYFKILDLIVSNPKETVFVIRGGQGAGKTISIIQLIIQSLCSSEKEATVLSSELSKMKRTVIRDYKKICKDWGLIKNDEDFNRSESKHEYFNDSYIDFLGADVNDVGKGFRRDILYINEADKINIDTAIQFISRAKLTIIDYNPDRLFWGDEFIKTSNFLTLTYLDNEFLPESEVKAILEYKGKGFVNQDLQFEQLFAESNIKNQFWANKWKVYGLGLVGNLEGVVFENWKIVDKIPKEAELLGYGMDFGFTNDPTALVALYRSDNEIYIDQLIYESDLRNSQISERMTDAGVDPYKSIYCDDADPKTRAELQALGWSNCTRANKDYINASIELLQGFTMNVTKRSTGLANELSKYTWKTDKTGKTLNEPIDTFNHAIDALRYVAMNKLRAGSGQYSISVL